ncbi:MAG: hypothetical protein ACYTER_10115 [Planctomycetota bacterium]|jgi:hypothetical protein
MRKTALLLCISVLAGGLLSTAAARRSRQAGKTGATPKGGRARVYKPVDIVDGDVIDFVNRISETLELNEPQKIAIVKLSQENRGILNYTHQNLQTAQKKLQSSVFFGDETEVEKLAPALAAAMKEHTLFQSAFMKSVRQRLNDKQIEKLNQMQSQFALPTKAPAKDAEKEAKNQ